MAGPSGGSAEKPVGLVCFGLARTRKPAISERHIFPGDRTAIRAATVDHAFKMIRAAVVMPFPGALLTIDPITAGGVVLATAATDAVYVMFSSSVAARKRLAAANWSSVWYLLSSFAVISYTQNWVYVGFAAAGSWLGAYASMTFLRAKP